MRKVEVHHAVSMPPDRKHLPAAPAPLRLIAGPLTAREFAPFGTVGLAPAVAGRSEPIGPAQNLRPKTQARLVWVVAQPTQWPATVSVMERHRFSSQSFVPCEAHASWLLVVAPHAPDGMPDMVRARAFLATGDQAMTYAPDVWHRPLCAIGRPARFATLTFRDGGEEDEEFVPVTDPITVYEA